MALQIFVNGCLQKIGNVYNYTYADELYENLKSSNLPGTHIRIVGRSKDRTFVYKCSLRENLWNKK